MKPWLLDRLQCPSCSGGPVEEVPPEGGPDGALRCAACSERYDVRGGIPILVRRGSPLAAGGPGEAPPPLRRLSVTTDASRQQAYWESDLGHRDARHPVVEAFARQRWTHLAHRLPLGEVCRALDVGCGNGFGSVHAPAGIQIAGCDGSLAMLERHPGESRLLADALALPFRPASWDLVFCWELLHHVPEPRKALAEMARVSRRWVVVFEPNVWNPAQFLFALADPEHRWVLRFTRRYLLGEVEAAGLRPVRHERVGLVFPNKTPRWLAAALRRLPFRVPLLGISQLVIAEKT